MVAGRTFYQAYPELIEIAANRGFAQRLQLFVGQFCRVLRVKTITLPPIQSDSGLLTEFPLPSENEGLQLCGEAEGRCLRGAIGIRAGAMSTPIDASQPSGWQVAFLLRHA